MAPPEGARVGSAGRSSRLAPLRRLSVQRSRTDDAAERILAHAHRQSHATLRLVQCAGERRLRTQSALSARALPAETLREEYRCDVRDALSALIEGMREWVSARRLPSNDGVLAWLVALPAALKATAPCADSVTLTDVDVEWLLRKGVLTLSLLLGTEEEQRAHALRRGVAVEEMSGFVERIGNLRAGFLPSPENDWLGAFAAARVPPSAVANYLLASFTYTANCRSRATVDGWEHSADDEWLDAPPPRRSDLHGPNASPWAVMNWSLRVAYDHTQSDDVRAEAAQSAAVFSALQDWIDEALAVLPKTRDAVFRGVRLSGLSDHYAPSRPVVFPPFTSTSTQGEEARAYAGANGTFFVMRSHSAARIDFVSFLPAEAEKLLPSFSRFDVVSRASNTVLRMLDCPYDIVTLAEHGDDDCTDAQAIDAYARCVRHTRFVYETYLRESYVEGRVASLPPPCDRTTPFFQALWTWISDGGNLLLLGSGGSGKTSATLAAHCALAERESVAPVFVPLPSVPCLFDDGALDAHVLRLFGLSASQMALLSVDRTVVVLLESLDEVMFPQGADVRAVVCALLERNPVTARARVVLSCRDEFLSRHSIAPASLFGPSGRVLYVQPFTADDVSAFVGKQCAKARLSPEASAAKLEAIASLRAGVGDAFLNPCVLHMACRISDARIREMVATAVGRIHASLVYEEYVRQEMDDTAGLAAMQRVALSMLARNEWHVTVGDVGREFALAGISPEVFRSVYLPRIPRRVESDANDGGAFAWWHKSIGEYLAARAFWHEPAEALASVQRPFSLDTPLVLSFFAGIAEEKPSERDRVCREVLVPAVMRSRESADAAVLAVASNALALACAARFLLNGTDLSRTVIQDADLRGARFTHALLAGATFRRCTLASADFSFADVTDAEFPNSTCELVMPPLKGHENWVTCLSFSPDGRFLASGSDDSTVMLWDAATGSLVREMSGHMRAVKTICFSPDGKRLASGSGDKTVGVWSVETGDVVLELKEHNSGIRCVCFSPDGATLATGSGSWDVRLWDAHTGKEQRRLSGHADSVTCVRFSADGTVLVSGSVDRTARLWRLSSGECAWTCDEHGDHVTCVAVSPDAQLVASGSIDRTIRIMDAAMGTTLGVLEGHGNAVTCLAFWPSGGLLASSSDDKTVRVWDIFGRELCVLEGHATAVRGVAVSPNGAVIATASGDKVVRVWKPSIGSAARGSDGHSDAVICVCASADGRLLASGSRDAHVLVWDAATCKLRRTLSGHSGWVTSVCFFPVGKQLVSGSGDKTMRVWDVATGAELRVLSHSVAVRSVAVSHDGALVVSGAADGAVKVWDATMDYALARSLEGHSAAVTAAVCVPGGAGIATASSDKTVRLWEEGKGDGRVLVTQSDSVRSLCFAPTTKRFAVSTMDGTVGVLSAEAKSASAVWSASVRGVSSLSFSADGLMLAGGLDDGTVRVWDAHSGEELACLQSHLDAVRCVVFVPASESQAEVLASCSADKTVRLWSLCDGVDASGTESRGKGARFALRAVIGRMRQFSSAKCVGTPRSCEGVGGSGLYASLVPV